MNSSSGTGGFVSICFKQVQAEIKAGRNTAPVTNPSHEHQFLTIYKNKRLSLRGSVCNHGGRRMIPEDSLSVQKDEGEV